MGLFLGFPSCSIGLYFCFCASTILSLSTKVCQVKAMVFLVVMYGCESWTIKKAEGWRIDASSISREDSWDWVFIGRGGCSLEGPGCSLEGFMLKLKLQYFGHLMWRADSLKRPWCWERLKAGGERDDRGWDGWMASPTWWTWVWVNLGSWWWTGRAGVLHPMGSQRFRHDWVTELNWFFNSLFVYILDCYH